MKIRKYIPELIVLVYSLLFLITKNPKSEWDRVIVSDGKGYYAYLTALFIYSDTDYSFIDQYESEYFPFSRQLYKDFRFDTGKGIVNKYFPGPAVLWLPFFAAGHSIAYLFGFQMDGYSLPYQMAIAFAAFFYFWLALLILRKILRYYTKDENGIAWTLLVTGLATNLVYYTVNSGCQVHVYNFFLINGFIYSVLLSCKHGRPSHYASAAFLLGMILISRPQNGIIVFALPFICGSRESLLSFFKNAFGNIKVFIPSLLAIALPLIIPITYWYFKTGMLLVYSYGTESFDLTNPHLFSFLFSFEKGWMLYTPVAAFSALGFIFLFRESKWQLFSLGAFLVLTVFFLSSWWTWTYTSYISQRVMIDYYAFLAILLIFIFKWLKTRKQKILLQVCLTFFIFLNLMQHFQQLNWIYPAGPVTAKSYFNNFFSFRKGTTFMIPEKEIHGSQSYSTDFERLNTHFNTNGFSFSDLSHSGSKSLQLDTATNTKPLFIRGMSDYQETKHVILLVSGFYKPGSCDSSLTIEVSIGNNKGKYSISEHNLMPGLKQGEWTRAEMAIYLPYIRSAADSLFVSYKNLTKSKVLLDDLNVTFLKMRGPDRHDWILSADDPVDSVFTYRSDFETKPEVPWSNISSITEQKAYSGSRASVINNDAPYSVAFEKELETTDKRDGYIRVSSRILYDSLSEIVLVFDFSTAGKTVFYKAYPISLVSHDNRWMLSEIFREFPVSRLKAQKVKIYYWMLKGNKPAYIDDLQIDIVRYKPVKFFTYQPFKSPMEATILNTACCDFEKSCEPQSGFQQENADAFSGEKVCLVNIEHPFSYSHLLSLSSINNIDDAFIAVNAKIQSDYYATDATLVADFRKNNRSFSYKSVYLRGQTIKGEWNTIETGFKIPEEISANDSVLIYFYLPKTEEVLLIDDFCVSIKQPSLNKKGRKK